MHLLILIFKSTKEITCQAFTHFMELTSSFQEQNTKKDTYYYLRHINNTICCFNCREFCKAEHETYSD